MYNDHELDWSWSERGVWPGYPAAIVVKVVHPALSAAAEVMMSWDAHEETRR